MAKPDAGQHQQTEGTDGVVGTMLQIHQLVEGLFPAQHQGEGTDEKGTEPQAHHDQGQVAGDREGTDGAIKAEGGIKQLEVDQAHQPSPGR